MAINPTPRIVAELKPKYEIKVDLDERAYLFPAGKSVSQLLFLSDGRRIFIEAVYPFNQSHTPPRLQRISSAIWRHEQRNGIIPGHQLYLAGLPGTFTDRRSHRAR